MIHGSDFLTFGSAGASIGSSLMVIAAIGWATP
jgi:purine-cytosine permease-like protein